MNYIRKNSQVIANNLENFVYNEQRIHSGSLETNQVDYKQFNFKLKKQLLEKATVDER